MKLINFNKICFFKIYRSDVSLFTFIACIVLSFANMTKAQSLRNENQSLSIPFEYVNNFMIISLTFEQTFPLKFIFDTGAEYSIITKREITDGLNIPYHKEYTVNGADGVKDITAFLIKNIRLDISQRRFEHQNMLVFKEDYFHLDDYIGMQIHGILGGNLFSQYVISIDYRAQRIIFYPPSQFKAPNKKYTAIPIEVHKSKPYLNAALRLSKDTLLPIKLLMDTGAGLTLLLQSYTHPELAVPPTAISGNIGFGLGGGMNGFIGRSKQLSLQSTFTFNNLFTRFQQLPDTMIFDAAMLNGRNGIIGNQLLEQFHVYIDYSNQMLYLKPNNKYGKDVYLYDRSGLTVIATGTNFSQYLVQHVLTNSPAALAGIRKGDVITKVNGINVVFLSLEQLLKRFQAREGVSVSVTVRRENGEMYKTSFRLKNLV